MEFIIEIVCLDDEKEEVKEEVKDEVCYCENPACNAVEYDGHFYIKIGSRLEMACRCCHVSNCDRMSDFDSESDSDSYYDSDN